jgi:hypothetical protein
VFFEQLKVAGFLRLLIVAVTQDDSQSRLAGLVLDAARHVGEERVRDIEDDKPDHAAPPGPELASRLVPDEAQ